MKWNLLPAGLGILLLLFCSCAPRSITKVWKTYPAQTPYADFVVLETTDSLPRNGVEKLGEIVLNQSFGPECDYPKVLDTAMAIARSWGANALKINLHQAPTMAFKGLSTCHRLKATALRLRDLNPYFKNLAWEEQRPLQVSDFRADPANRPFIAATVSFIQLYWEMRVSQKEAVVQSPANFVRHSSYFSYRVDSLDVLAHEQGHFDLTETYARKFRKNLSEHEFHLRTWTEEVQKMYDAIVQELQIQQDHYDHDVYADPHMQTAWSIKISFGLRSYQDYSNDKSVLTLKP